MGRRIQHTSSYQPDPQQLRDVYLWLARPRDGETVEHMLMVQVSHPVAGAVYRPLLAATEEEAFKQAEIAQRAAQTLDVDAVLRKYRLVPVDLLEITKD